MATTAETSELPLTDQIAPASQDELAAAIRDAAASETPVYTIGGGTSLDFGLPAKKPGVGLSTTGLSQIIDYPSRDLTITVEAGMTMETLSKTLAEHGQWIPIDVPQAASATIGGVVATNFSGSRRYGQGTIRDYVIGIRAVDGRGEVFSGGGRVVKNVAGYDFCKLLIGSLGTLGVVTQLTLKLKPRPTASALLCCEVADADHAEHLLADMISSETTPSAVELVSGPAWREESTTPHWARLIVSLEGTRAEVDWMREQLGREWNDAGVSRECITAKEGDKAQALWAALAEFPADDQAPLVLKACVPPSRVTEYIELTRQIDPECSIQAHAGDGVVIVRFSKFDAADVGRILVGKLHAVAAGWGGGAVVLSSPGGGLTRQAVWGGRGPAVDLMEAVRRQFDPHGILNPGRYLYEN